MEDKKPKDQSTDEQSSTSTDSPPATTGTGDESDGSQERDGVGSGPGKTP